MMHGLKLGLVALILSMAALPAAAQGVNCADRDVLAGKLSSEHSESQQVIGLTADGRLIEVFASPEGTWTLILTRPDGRACVVTYGNSLQVAPAKDRRPVS